jgi:ABC-type lipoprotein export system ATPase subunit
MNRGIGPVITGPSALPSAALEEQHQDRPQIGVGVALIEARGLDRTYGKGAAAVHAVNGMDLDIADGDFIALMGPSGCGKSTLLHLLGGLDDASGGTVTVAGQLLTTMNESERAILRRATIGVVFQAYNLVPNLSVRDNVDLPGRLARRENAEVARRRDELLDQLGLSDRHDALPSELSGGQQQRAAIARALINDPAVLLADEPTGNLDSRSGREVLDLLATVNAAGQTIVMVTHDPVVAAHANRVLFLRDGRLVSELPSTGPQDASLIAERLADVQRAVIGS